MSADNMKIKLLRATVINGSVEVPGKTVEVNPQLGLFLLNTKKGTIVENGEKETANREKRETSNPKGK